MKRGMALILIVAVAGALGADEPDADRPLSESLADAAKLSWEGTYARAVRVYEQLDAAALARPDVAVAYAQALSLQGKFDSALEALGAAAEAGEGDLHWRVAMAGAMSDLGRYEDALTHAAEANELAATWAPAILAHGRVLEVFGRLDDALAVYETMSDALEDEPYADRPAQLVALGQILDRYATLKGLTASEQAANIFNNYFQKTYQDLDARYWPAHLAAGQFALAKQRPKTAHREFEAVLEINPNCADAIAGIAELALRDWAFEASVEMTDRALTINPNCAAARLTKARCLLQWQKVSEVLPVLEDLLETNPHHEEALAVAAAACVRLGESDDADAYAARVAEVNPAGWLVPTEIGKWLSAIRQFSEAETYLQQAVTTAPHAAEPLTELGLLYMQTGDEDRAREVFAEAHGIDDFRADVVNYLNLLRRMRDFTVRETEHFLITVDGEQDMGLLDVAAREAERIYDEVCDELGREPAEKTMLQLFPTHRQFSIRITGRGWIGTVGACTGRVIAMVVPHPQRSEFGVYNWVAVLRHEFTHTVTLSATENRIPHWLTEAFAVWQQPDRRNYDSVEAIVAAVRTNRLFPVRELTWGFVRPRRQGDRGLAYAQSELILEYIIETKGFETALGMLEAFRERRSQEDIFSDLLGVTENQFDRAFSQWVAQRVADWGFDAHPIKDLRLAALAVDREPDNVEYLAQFAEALYYDQHYTEAKDAAAKALAIDADQPIAVAVAAEVALVEQDLTEAIRLATHLERLQPGSARSARILADANMARQDYIGAIEALERLKQRRPLDSYSYIWLTNIYSQLGETDRALPNLLELHRRTLSEEQFARRIADYYQSQGFEADALAFYEQVTHINPYEASAYEAMAAIHRNAGRFDRAVSSAQTLTYLRPESAEAWAKLAMVRFVAGRSAGDVETIGQARIEAARSVELDPDGPGGPILDRIDQTLNDLQPDDSEAS